MVDRRPGNRALVAFSAVTIVAGGIALAVAKWRASTSPGGADEPRAWSAAAASSISGVDIRQSVTIPFAMLNDEYEHNAEQAPPRGVNEEMQRREQFYSVPADPFDTMNSTLGKTPADKTVRFTLNAVKESWERGAGISAPVDLESALAECSIDSVALLKMARGIQFLTGDDLGATFERAAIAKAGREFANRVPGDPKSLPLLHELDQTKLLWDRSEFVALQARFILARRLYPSRSVEARRSAFLIATTLFKQARFAQADAMLKELQADDDAAGDMQPDDMVELRWLVGQNYFASGHFSEAANYLEGVGKSASPHARQAASLYAECLWRLGWFAKANEVRARLGKRPLFVPPSTTQPSTRTQ